MGPVIQITVRLLQAGWLSENWFKFNYCSIAISVHKDFRPSTSIRTFLKLTHSWIWGTISAPIQMNLSVDILSWISINRLLNTADHRRAQQVKTKRHAEVENIQNQSGWRQIVHWMLPIRVVFLGIGLILTDTCKLQICGEYKKTVWRIRQNQQLLTKRKGHWKRQQYLRRRKTHVVL